MAEEVTPPTIGKAYLFIVTEDELAEGTLQEMIESKLVLEQYNELPLTQLPEAFEWVTNEDTGKGDVRATVVTGRGSEPVTLSSDEVDLLFTATGQWSREHATPEQAEKIARIGGRIGR